MYSGVSGVMIGEAFVKASLFGSNYWALSVLTHDSTDSPSILILCLAAAFSGVVSSFVLNPIERVKILMQADQSGRFKSELDCVAQVISKDGVTGLLTRGLDGMIIRELPGYVCDYVSTVNINYYFLCIMPNKIVLCGDRLYICLCM